MCIITKTPKTWLTTSPLQQQQQVLLQAPITLQGSAATVAPTAATTLAPRPSNDTLFTRTAVSANVTAVEDDRDTTFTVQSDQSSSNLPSYFLMPPSSTAVPSTASVASSSSSLPISSPTAAAMAISSLADPAPTPGITNEPPLLLSPQPPPSSLAINPHQPLVSAAALPIALSPPTPTHGAIAITIHLAS
jgi:hypothetical protein